MRPITLSIGLAGIFLSACGSFQSVTQTDTQSSISSGDNKYGISLKIEDYRAYFSARKQNEIKGLIDKPEIQREIVLDYHSDIVLERYAESLKLLENDVIRERIAQSKRNILVAALVDKITREIQYPTEGELRERAHEYYLHHQSKFRHGEKRRVAHILLKDFSDCPCELPSVQERLADLQARIEENEDFATLAAEFSDDTSNADKGGEISMLVERDGRMVKEFEHAVFALAESGEISKPIETRFGTHIIKLLEVLPADLVPFEDVQNQLIKVVKRNFLNSELEKLRADAYPKLETMNLDLLNDVLRELSAETEPTLMDSGS